MINLLRYNFYNKFKINLNPRNKSSFININLKRFTKHIKNGRLLW